MSSLTGQQIKTYRIGPRLGAGGMAEVYEGEHVDARLGNKVAIKVLLSQYSDNTELVSRFKNEARALTRISHPGVVSIYDVDSLPDGRVCIIMEFLRGKTLQTWRRERTHLSLEEVLPMMIQLADTMAAAHDQSIIHRDIKPENIFVLEHHTGLTTKILDFGVAKLVGDAGAVRTRTRTQLGTAAYMPPEQFRSSKDVDHRSDIYALGCVYFELFAGRPPFVANTLVDHMRMHVYEQPPPLRQFVPWVPGEIEDIIMRMLAKSIADRPSSMREIKLWLEAFMTGAPLPQVGAESSPYQSPAHSSSHPASPSYPTVPPQNQSASRELTRPKETPPAVVHSTGAGPAKPDSSATKHGLIIAIVAVVLVVAGCAALFLLL